MGKIGEEITQKIKSAVKAKLVELGVEVDNELPDYIMVLVANKKTHSQMEKDLQLFLGPNTVLFTTWLVNVLKKLEEVTVSKKNYKRIEVTSQEGSLVVTKKEEDAEKQRSLKKPVRIKTEPGNTDAEGNEDCIDISTTKDPGIEEGGSDVRTSLEQDAHSSENEGSENQSQHYDSASPIPDQGSPNRSVADDDKSNNEDSSQKKSVRSPSNASADDHANTDEGDQGSESNEDNSVEKDNSGKTHSSDPARPKIVYGIREQIDQVMEKTINGNKRPRDVRGRSIDDDDDRDDRRRSTEDSRKSLENDLFDRGKFSDNRDKGDRKSLDDYDKLRSVRRKSPENRRKTHDESRRSPDFLRRSPFHRSRVSEYSRRSPDMRRRSPLPRRRSPDDRRRSPFDRRRSPDDRRRSPEDRRRTYDDRGRRDDRRRSPDDRTKVRVTDAREILKRKTGRNDDSHLEHSSAEDSHRSEKRRKVVSSLVHKPEEPRDRSSEPQIPSLVRVTPRPLRKDAIQPNKKLLLLAVADAEKSVSKPYTKRPERLSSPPTSSHSSSRKRELPKSDDRMSMNDPKNSSSIYIPPEKIFVTLTNNKAYSKDDNKSGNYGVSREVSAKKLYEDIDLTVEDELLYEEQYFDYDQDDPDAEELYPAELPDEYVPVPVKDSGIQTAKNNINAENTCIITLESSPERSGDEWEDASKQNEEKEDSDLKAEEAHTPPQQNVESHPGEKLDEWGRLGPALIATVKPLAQGSGRSEKFKGDAVNKSLERCKYWPNCLSEKCIYFHPSTPCKMFPHCKSGKECLFIHPDCKFSAACLNPKCSFLHRPATDPKKKVVKVTGTPVTVLPSVKPHPPLIKCVYFPNCKNLSCKFWHPVKNCKYGRTCARSDCYFFHPTLVIPPKELLTWSPKI